MPLPERDGYAFKGWFTSETGGDTVTTNTSFDKATTVYAQWIPITSKMYIVTFDAHGGAVSPKSGVTGEDGKLLAALPTPVREGYDFKGWFTEEAEVTANTIFTANTTIHAQWKIVHYEITFDATGGTVTPSSGTTGSHWELMDELPVPVREGYTFIGWYSEKDGGIHITATTPLVGVSAIYAHWSANPPSLVDSRDGKEYREVAIGEQIWMAENLDYETANSVCFNDSAEYCVRYGRLYDWSEAVGACPAGWHLPDADDWAELVDFIGEPSGPKLKSKEGWPKSGNAYDFNGTDNFGFSALPGGYWNTAFGSGPAIFWSASEVDGGEAFVLYIYDGSAGPVHGEYIWPKSAGLSVRCLQD